MRRRDFLAWSGLGLGSSLVSCRLHRTGQPRPGEPDLLAQLVAQNAQRVRVLLERQQVAPDHPSHGGTPDRFGIYHAGAASGLVRDFAAAYAAPGSPFRGSLELRKRLLAAARFLVRAQHDDGTIDLLTTNFHSPPDVAFVFEWVCSAAGVLRDLRDDGPGEVLETLDAFIERGANALVVGGIHTPNHRWVVSMALARAHALHPDPRYVARIDEWLAEGIDIDPDGQFTERSTSIYSPLTDRCLITIARLLDRPELLEPARRNLEMTLFYLHANGEVVTESSRRQDQYKRGHVYRYHYPYRFMALAEGNERFAAVAEWTERTVPERLTHELIYFLEDPSLRRPLPSSAPLPTNFEREFPHSKLARIRRDQISATILADNASFLSLHHGSASVVLRFASAFFGKGQFVGDALRKSGDEWVLEQKLVGPYYQPLPPARIPGDGDWSKMPREDRRQSEVQHLHSVARIREVTGGLAVRIAITGTAHVPVAIELGFGTGGAIGGAEPLEDGTFILATGRGRFVLNGESISFGPGRATHSWTQLRGALDKLPGDSVYLTGTTPFDAELRFECET